LADEARQNGGQWLHGQVAQIDPTAAARLHPNDTRRLIRALEVYQKTGRPISQWQQQFDVGRPAEECRVFVLDWPKAELHARIDRRVAEMFAAGLTDEVRRLLAGPRPLSRTARQAVGYREVIAHLEGRGNLNETVELVRQHTRQLAKRQGTWFRSLSECRFVAVDQSFCAEEVAKHIAEGSGRKTSAL
jgi:tRNA dimethylallyltransferase